MINAWYLDDRTLCGSLNDLSAALSIIESVGPSRGLVLNRSKSLLYVPADVSLSNNPLPQSIPVTNVGFDLLGSPIGPLSHCESFVLKRVEKVQDILSKLSDLQEFQMETTLLRSCLALPKVAFALRTCPPILIQQALVAFDYSMQDTLSDLAGGPLSDWAWLKASLPCSLGGLNIRQAMFHAPAAYICSLHQSHPPVSPVHLPHCIDALAEAACRPEWSSLQDIDFPLCQCLLSRVIDEASYDSRPF